MLPATSMPLQIYASTQEKATAVSIWAESESWRHYLSFWLFSLDTQSLLWAFIDCFDAQL